MPKVKDKSIKVINKGGPFGWIFFTAWIGALVYFVGKVDGFWNIVLAFLKSTVWPAYVLHHVLVLLKV